MPAQRLPWFKLWPEAIDHEKIAQLSDGAFRTWVTVLARAADQPTRWRFASVKHAAVTTGRPVSQVKILVARRLLDDHGEAGLWIHDWKQWQERYVSDFEHSANTPPSLPEDSANTAAKTPRRLREDSPECSDKKKEVRREKKEYPPPATQGPPPREQRRVTKVDDAFKGEIEEHYWEAMGSREAIRDCIADAMSHKALSKRTDQRAYLRNWIRREAEGAAARRRLLRVRAPVMPISSIDQPQDRNSADPATKATCADCGVARADVSERLDRLLCPMCWMRAKQSARGGPRLVQARAASP